MPQEMRGKRLLPQLRACLTGQSRWFRGGGNNRRSSPRPAGSADHESPQARASAGLFVREARDTARVAGEVLAGRHSRDSRACSAERGSSVAPSTESLPTSALGQQDSQAPPGRDEDHPSPS